MALLSGMVTLYLKDSLQQAHNHACHTTFYFKNNVSFLSRYTKCKKEATQLSALPLYQLPIRTEFITN